MQREPIDLKHREMIANAFSKMTANFSEYSFTNLYLFREIHKYQVIIDDVLLSIEGITREGIPFVMPLFNISEVDGEKRKELVSQKNLIFPVSENDLVLFNDENYSHSYSINDSDYVFSVQKIATYPGRNLHKKRNLMKQFLEMYSWYKKDLNSATASEASEILEIWQKETGLSDELTDYKSCSEAISHIDDFKLTGTIFYVSDEPAGFVLGEALAKKSYALHFAKGLVKFKGIYQSMYNIFAKELLAEYEWINFEQDLGIPALRQAKESYQPDMMLHKYRVSLK